MGESDGFYGDLRLLNIGCGGSFNEQTGELVILKGDKVVAKTTAHLQERAKEAHGTTPRFRDNELVSVTLGGRQDLVIRQGNSTTGQEQ